MDIRDEIANVIRRNDGRNVAKPQTLAMSIEDELQDRDIYTIEWKPLAEFIESVNPDKSMGAGALSDAIVTHFDLD